MHIYYVYILFGVFCLAFGMLRSKRAKKSRQLSQTLRRLEREYLALASGSEVSARGWLDGPIVQPESPWRQEAFCETLKQGRKAGCLGFCMILSQCHDFITQRSTPKKHQKPRRLLMFG